jgi:hypothetical protein
MHLSPKQRRPTGNVVTDDELSVSLFAGGGTPEGALPFLLFPLELLVCVAKEAAQC